jgi:hypothetical protein
MHRDLEPRVTSEIHTSELVARLMQEAPQDTVDLNWLLGHLRHRSFGLVLLILAIAVAIPGLSVIASVLIAFPAVEMMLGRHRPTLPGFLVHRAIPTHHFTKWAERSLPLLRFFEAFSRSRWHTPAEATKRVVGLIVFVLAISSIWPVPLINIVPALIIMLISIAYLGEDGLLLGIALAIAIASLLVFAWVLWVSVDAIEAGGWIHMPRGNR